MSIEKPEANPIKTPSAEELAQIPVHKPIDTEVLPNEPHPTSSDEVDSKKGIFLRAFDTRTKRIGWGVTGALSAASIVVSAAVSSQAKSKPTELPGRTPAASAPLNPTESPAPSTGEIRPGYKYADTPVIELGPVPVGLEKQDGMTSDQYIATATIQERADYGAYLSENIFTYAERFALITGNPNDMLKPVTPDSPTVDLLKYENYIQRLGYSFQSKEDPTKVDVDKALKLWASYFYTSGSTNNDSFNIMKKALLEDPTFIDVDRAATGRLFSIQYNVTNEGLNQSGLDFSGNTVPMRQNFTYTSDQSTSEATSTTFFYNSEDPLSGKKITVPISLGINGHV